MKVRRIKQLPPADRPRERMLRLGAQALSDFELLEVLIGNGNQSADVGYIAKQLQKLLQKGTESLSYDALTLIKGVNVVTACKVLSSLELAKRYLVRDVSPLRTQKDILARIHDIRDKQQEYFVCISLDGGQRLIAQRIVTIGTLDSVMAHPREVFADVIADRAASVVIAHNHPSGDVRPSEKDIALTQQLVAAGQLIGIDVRDHLIATKTEYFSFRQHHML